MTHQTMYMEAVVVILMYMLLLRETKDKALEYELRELNYNTEGKGEELFK